MKDAEKMTLATLLAGQIILEADQAMDVVAQNIHDGNTKATQKRSLVIRIDFIPNEQRDIAQVSFGIDKKLAALKPLRTSVSIAATKDGAVMTELVSRQMDMVKELEVKREKEQKES